MLGLGSADVLVRTTTFVQVGRYNAIPPDSFVKLPKARAAHWLAVGHAAAVDAVPDDVRLIAYSEADFVWAGVNRRRRKEALPRPRQRETKATRWQGVPS